MGYDLRLVDKGTGQPRDALAQEGKVHVGLAEHHAAELEKHGWAAADTAALKANVALLEDAVGTQVGAWDEAGVATSAEAQAIDAAKSFLRRLRNALPRALRESPGSGVTASAFEVGDSLQRSTPKISKHLSAIRPAVVKLDPALKKHFNGQLASVLLDQIKAALDDADTTQEVTRKNAPVQTQALYEHMGRVLEQIEDLNRAGKSAFDGDSTMQGKFNKDILLRGRKTAKKTAPKDPKGDGAPVNGMQTPVSPAGGAQAPGAPS